MKGRLMMTVIGVGIIAIGTIVVIKRMIKKSDDISDTDLREYNCRVDGFDIGCFGPVDIYDGPLILKEDTLQECSEK